jgi:hypothetical protein
MSRYIGRYVSTCDMCLCTKPSHNPPTGELHLLFIPNAPLNTISVDFIVKLPESAVLCFSSYLSEHEFTYRNTRVTKHMSNMCLPHGKHTLASYLPYVFGIGAGVQLNETLTPLQDSHSWSAMPVTIFPLHYTFTLLFSYLIYLITLDLQTWVILILTHIPCFDSYRSLLWLTYSFLDMTHT